MRGVEERSLSSILRSELLTTLINNDVWGKLNAGEGARELWIHFTDSKYKNAKGETVTADDLELVIVKN
jgi:hypothetical protein